MKVVIKHESRGRMRVHLIQNRMTCGQADILLYYLQRLDGVTEEKVYERSVSGKAGDEGASLVSASRIVEGDLVVIHMGNVIPFDGLLEEESGQ